MIEIQVTERHIYVKSPFHPDFPRRANEIGGEWTGNEWIFDVRHEEMARKLCKDIYGTDGSDLDDLVTLRCKCEGPVGSAVRSALYIGPYQVARAFSRDSGAKLGANIVVVHGAFESGGSLKNWYTKAEAGTEIEISGVPRGMADAIMEDCNWKTNVKGNEEWKRAALLDKRARLLAQIEEINRELSSIS